MPVLYCTPLSFSFVLLHLSFSATDSPEFMLEKLIITNYYQDSLSPKLGELAKDPPQGQAGQDL